MASTYSPNLRLELIGTGEQQGTWGATTNTNLGTLLEEAIGGYVSVTVTDGADTTLTSSNGAADQSRNMVINLTGTLTATRNVICPAIEKVYIVRNATTGGFAVTFKVSGQTGVSVPNGQTMLIYVDGTDARQTYGTIAAQNANNVSITGGSITGVSVMNSTNATVSSTLTVATANVTSNLTAAAASVTANLTANNISVTNTLTAATVNATSNIIAVNATVTGTLNATNTVTFSGTGAAKMPTGTTAQRPTPTTGMFRFNTNTTSFEGYNGTSWGSVGGGATGAGGDAVFYLNSPTVTTTYSIPSGQNAMCVGPITINSGATVTVPSGSRWVVL